MNRKLSRSNRALLLFFVITAAILCVATVYVPKIVDEAIVRQSSKAGLFITAGELAEKPQTYFILNNPDAYIFQAITSPKEFVFIGAVNNSQIGQIIDTYGDNFTVNVEYNSHYYNIAKGWVTPNSPQEMVLTPILILSWTLWGISAIIAVVITVVFKKRKG